MYFRCLISIILINLYLTLDWRYFQDFYNADKVIYKVEEMDPEVAGYAKCFGKFCHVVVRNAGHVAMYDQPRVTLDMMRRFIYSKPFTN